MLNSVLQSVLYAESEWTPYSGDGHYGAYIEYDVRYTVGKIDVERGVRNFCRGVRENGGSSEPPEPPPPTWLRACISYLGPLDIWPVANHRPYCGFPNIKNVPNSVNDMACCII